MNISEHSFGSSESYRVTSVPKQYVMVEMLRGGEVVAVNRFELGDVAEYDSYNLKYYGKIVAIGAKTVTIQEKYADGRKHRLDMRTFAFRNYDFDLAAAAEHNQTTMQHI